MIEKEQVKNIAKLARINLNQEEIEKFQKDLSSILEYFESLKKVNTDKIIPTFHTSEAKENVIRKDESISDIIANDLIGQAPDKKDRYIKVRAIFK